MLINPEAHTRKINVLSAMETERQLWWPHWRTLADYYMPRRYAWLLSPQERQNKLTVNPFVLDPTGTSAAKTQASGMMNGITSPSRPWFRAKIAGVEEDDQEAHVWSDEVTRRMLLAMAETNFYNSMALIYLDLSIFGTAASLIYEDHENVFRCYNCALGEYYLGQSDRQVVNQFAREFTYKVHQVVEWFGLENCSELVQTKFKNGGANVQHDVALAHLIEPNIGKDKIPGSWEFREAYWEIGREKGLLLKQSGFNEVPGIFPRWEITANDSYGTSPGMDGLGDVIQLQHETKKKAQGLDKTIDPPVIADIQLQHKPMALLPRGVTYVAGINNVGAKPVYQIQLPLDQLSADIADVQIRIRETFNNDLFKMISQLDTVRSATEIDARREEKLVLLGPVLERFENEALDPAIKRIYGIMERAGLLPDAPAHLQGQAIEVQYMSILTSAQTAVATIPMERFLGLVGSMVPVYPNARHIPNWEETLRDYGRALGVRAKNINAPEVTEELIAEDEAVLKAQSAAQTGEVLVNSAKALSETEVGGGANALSRLINPFGA